MGSTSYYKLFSILIRRGYEEKLCLWFQYVILHFFLLLKKFQRLFFGFDFSAVQHFEHHSWFSGFTFNDSCECAPGPFSTSRIAVSGGTCVDFCTVDSRLDECLVFNWIDSVDRCGNSRAYSRLDVRIFLTSGSVEG